MVSTFFSIFLPAILFSTLTKGWLWSRLAFTTQNFVIEVEFKISGDSSHLYGDGLALWLTTDRAQPGPVFGSKGLHSFPQSSLPLLFIACN